MLSCIDMHHNSKKEDKWNNKFDVFLHLYFVSLLFDVFQRFWRGCFHMVFLLIYNNNSPYYIFSFPNIQNIQEIMNNDILFSTELKSIELNAAISMPSQIKALFEMNPRIDIRLIDYDYIGEAKGDDYASFAEKLYKANPNAHYMLIMHSNELKDSLLVRKKFQFDLTGFNFNEEIKTWCVPISTRSIIFLGVIEIETFEDLKTAIRFLFSGIYDSQNFLIQHGGTFVKSEIMALLERALCPIKNRYGENQNVIISMPSICQHKKGIKVLYPYGGTDFGSFMLFVI